MPYASLTHSARARAARGEEDFIINSQGGLTAKGFDRRDERSIELVDWLGAARVAEDRTRFHHGNARADALASHHQVVTDMARSHGWPVAVEYDIKQRELSAQHPQHDLSFLDRDQLTMIVTAMALEAKNSSQQESAPVLAPASPSKRQRTDSTITTPRKRTSKQCFRCGFAGHMPESCKAETTSAGRPVAAIDASRGKNCLVGPNNKPFCFNWAKDSICAFGSNCRNLHACSLCGSSSHGAAGCQARA